MKKAYLLRRPSWSKGQRCWGNGCSKEASKAWPWSVGQARRRRKSRRTSGEGHKPSHIGPSLCIATSSPPPPPTSYTGIPHFRPQPYSFPKRTVFPTTLLRTHTCLLVDPHTLFQLQHKIQNMIFHKHTCVDSLASSLNSENRFIKKWEKYQRKMLNWIELNKYPKKHVCKLKKGTESDTT